MRMTATTHASWTASPMKCEPLTPRQGCRWWGRGAIQTTGPLNYRKMQQALDSLVNDATFGASARTVDLCTNPGAVCEKADLKWFGAIEYWTRIVQESDDF